MALVFLTVLPDYDLQPYLPGPVAAALKFFMRLYHRVVGVTVDTPPMDTPEFDAEGRVSHSTHTREET